MTAVEHAIENAIFAIAKDKTYEKWLEEEKNRNLRHCNATSDEIWLIAQHVCFALFCDETFAELRKKELE